MEKGVTAELKKFNKGVAETGEDVAFRVFPNKILELQTMILSSSNLDSPFNITSQSTDATVYPTPSDSLDDGPASKKRKISPDAFKGDSCSEISSSNDTSNARFPSLVKANTHVKFLHDIIKKECEELASSIDKLKLWVTLTMPKIEDGDNFGVQVQEEVLSEIHRAQESAYNLRDLARQDYLARAKICSKLIKYPHIEDYTLALQEHDEKQIYYARQHLHDIRNLYAALTDIIHKNISKIRSPKANNSSGLY